MTAERIARLRGIMARLRDPNGGCAWDLEQTFETIAPHTIEEAYEVADAIDRGDHHHLCEELGDLMFQVIFYAQMAEEQNLFTFNDILDGLNEKLVRRHPHVFDDRARLHQQSVEGINRSWEQIKADERRTNTDNPNAGVLGGVARALPSLTRASKLGRRAARVGFDWPTVARILEKVDEERVELQEELDQGAEPSRTSGELGDLLFVLAQLARKLDLDPEAALHGTNAKFERRFSYIESALKARGVTPDSATLEEMEELWQMAKQHERQGGASTDFA